MRIGSSENENHVWRRLFQRFKEGVGALARYHMHFVDYIDFITQDIRRIVDPLLKVIHIIDTAIAGFVYLDNIQCAAPINSSAGFTGIARFSFNRVFAIDCFSEDACGACLAAAARSAEQVSMGNPIVFNGIKECLCYMFLAGYFVECLGTPFTIKNLGSHSADIIP